MQSRGGRALKKYVGKKREIYETKNEGDTLIEPDEVTVTHSVMDLQDRATAEIEETDTILIRSVHITCINFFLFFMRALGPSV